MVAVHVLHLPCYVCCFFFFKQKTADEMRISDWSSDVCSSDLDIELQPGDTLIAALSDAGLPYAEAHSAAQGLESVVDPRRLKAGQAITLDLQPTGEGDDPHLQRLSLVPDLDRLVVLEHQPDERFSEIGRASGRERVCT